MLLALILLTVAGCSSSGAFLASNRTSVNLQSANYTVQATDISGTAESGYILGASFSNGLVTSTLALARVNGTGALYTQALQNLWAQYKDRYGAVEGRNLALTNVRYDADILNLILYTRVKVTVRADIVEFQD